VNRVRIPLSLSLVLLAACAQNLKPDAAPAATLKLDGLTRTDFNRTAAEHFLPLYWREDVNQDGVLQPAELAVLWGYPEDQVALWRDASGAFTPRFFAAYASLSAPPAAAPTHRQALVIQELAQSAPTLVYTDLSTSSDADKALVKHLQAAAMLIEKLYARQNGVLDMQAQIPVDDLASRALYHRNQSVFCVAPQTEKEPECTALVPKPPRRPGIYPLALQEMPDFCAQIEKAPNAAALMDPFTVVTNGPAPGSLEAVPYAFAWADDMGAVALELEGAASGLGADEAALAAYLRAAAASFRSNDWEPANRAWKAMNAHNSRWYVRVAPDEVYYDPCAWKAGFALQLARINPDSIAWQQKLEPHKSDMEKQLAAMAGPPYRARDVQFALPDFIDVVLNAGDQRSPSGATIGQSLPNWGAVAESGGRTVAMTNLYTDPDSRARRDDLGAALYCAGTNALYHDTGTETTTNSLLHEAAHNLGPAHDYAVRGQTATVAFGGPLASTMEELKAQNTALYLTSFLAGRGIFTEDAVNRILRDGLSWAFGHISRGMYTAEGTPRNYSQLAAIQVGTFIDAGAVNWHADETAANGKDKGCFEVDYAKFPGAVEALEKNVLAIKAKADRAGAEGLVARYVDGKDRYADIKATIAERYQRTPLAVFVYSIDP
jgi:hypothetical protein